jgi:hypothetical protein
LQKVDIKTAQELLRHANSRITIDFYQQSVSGEKRHAQALAFQGLLGEVGKLSTLQHPESGKKEEGVTVSD